MKHSLSSIHKVFLGFFLLFFSSVFIVFALDVVSNNFDPQPATSSGSNNSTVWFSTGGLSLDETASGTTSYINKTNDSDTIGNYLRGYYYDTQFGFFRLDWNLVDTTKNVRIISSTDKCGTGYGYKFGGYAYGEAGGYIKFDYNNDIFVYYCESDDKLHGYAYSEHTGFQSFEGLSFEIIALSGNTPSLTFGSDSFFVNNTSLILMGLSGRSTDIQGESVANQKGREVIFYIVK
ncbi:MAG: hypothetical protein Q8K26_04115 [Candidatus Gracilibacteria bacterium]|nr:hypothetical protein [Candidatus Gracilibacteria bacterium]